MSPLGLASAGMARVRVASVPRGRPGDSAVMDSAIMDSDSGHGQVISAQLDIGASSGLAYRIGASPVPRSLSQVGRLESGARRGPRPAHPASIVTYAKKRTLFIIAYKHKKRQDP